MASAPSSGLVARPGPGRAALWSIAAAACAALALTVILLALLRAPAGGSMARSWVRTEASVVSAPDLVADPARPVIAPVPPIASGAAAAGIRRRVARAREIAASAPGVVSFAVIGADGKIHGFGEHRLYPSASVVKSMLLAAELRRLHSGSLPLDPATAATLRAMITYSDNDAATTIFGRVGTGGLQAVAERASMSDFEVELSWGFARISAADMALLFDHLDQAFPREHRRFAEGLLGSIVAEQSWGIPAVAPPRWNVRFKGGWRPTASGQLVHQAAELNAGDRHMAIAVLTNGQASMGAGIDLVERIGARLIGR